MHGEKGGGISPAGCDDRGPARGGASPAAGAARARDPSEIHRLPAGGARVPLPETGEAGGLTDYDPAPRVCLAGARGPLFAPQLAQVQAGAHPGPHGARPRRS